MTVTRFLSMACMALCLQLVEAQNIQATQSILTFPNTDETQPSRLQLQIVNPGIYPIRVVDVDLFDKMEHTPFEISDTAFMLNPLDTQILSVDFIPEQNLFHNMGLVVKTNSGFGHVAVELEGQGTFSNTYYSGTLNLMDGPLRTALKSKLGQGYVSLGYNSARDQMYGSLDNSAGFVTCVYTGRTAAFTTRAGANTNNFNCEHTFPQGFFNQAEPMRSDIHHLFPTDVNANSQRGNLPFGIVSGTPTWQSGGSKKNSSTFEPRNDQKGATARAMMYFVIRYQDYSNHFSGQESILRQWHQGFAPTNTERQRNNGIAALQTSRNPFVDYPQLEKRIFSFTSNASRPLVKALYLSDDTIQLAQLAGSYTYNFVLYNSGTDDLTLANFALSDTALSFDQGAPITQNLAPGEFLEIPIRFEAGKSYSAQLSFTSNEAGTRFYDIPIRSGTDISLDEGETIGVQLYPNPSTGRVKLAGFEQIERLRLTSLAGKLLTIQLGETMDLSHLQSGMYIFEIELKNGDLLFLPWTKL